MSVAVPSPLDSCSAGPVGTIIPVDIAAAKAIAAATRVAAIEHVDLLSANGRVLAATMLAQLDLPPFDAAAMDGYAMPLASMKGPGPWRLPVDGRVAAGDDPTGLTGRAIRILTGAPVPAGFDAVVMQERCRRDGEVVIIDEKPETGRHIRVRGEDVRKGQLLFEGGEILGARQMALLAGQGCSSVAVRRKVRVGIISTGSELREPGSVLAPGEVFNSNRIMLRAMLDDCRWADVVDLGIVPDTPEAISVVLQEAAALCDAVITTGGVSAGEEDHVATAVGSGGGVLDVMKVAMRPGKPVKVGRLGEALFLGLPGNPNATLVTFRMIALPALRKLAGMNETGPVWRPVVADFAYQKRLGRTEFVPVRLVTQESSPTSRVRMLGRGSSASLRAIADSDGIAVLPPDIAAIEPGQSLRCEMF